jgi:hypothetical protein
VNIYRRQSPALAASGLNATVSGSFRKAIDGVQPAVQALADAGVLVLSPADPQVVEQFGDFVFVASDRVRRIRTVQGRHLASIAASDFLWLVAPDGYVGVSAAMEIGYAAAREVPIYCTSAIADLTLRQWVTIVDGPRAAIAYHLGRASRCASDNVLLDPSVAIGRSHDDLLIAQRGLVGLPTLEQTAEAEAAVSRLRERLAVP